MQFNQQHQHQPSASRELTSPCHMRSCGLLFWKVRNDMSEDQTILRQLQKSTLGAVLDDRHLATLAQIVIPVHEPSGSILFKEGAPANALWVVCSGAIALDIQVSGRAPVRVQTLGPRDLLGWSALVGDGSMTTTATAIEDTQLLQLPAMPLKELCLADHTLGYAVMGNVARSLANRLHGTRLQLVDLYTESEPAPNPSRETSL